MSIIKTGIQINAPIALVFDLCRSIDLHMISTSATKEKAIAGVTTGLINKDETVTWEAYHLFKKRYFQTIISEMKPYSYFRDEMLKGDFKSFYHEHFFEQGDHGVLVWDKLKLEAPYGLLGKIVNRFFLKNYIQKFLIERNRIIKHYAESGEWEKILNADDPKYQTNA